MRKLVAVLVALVLLVAGGVVGFAASGGEKTTTVVQTRVDVRTKIKTRTRTVKVRPTVTRTEVRTRTRVVTQPPTSSFLDYGEWDGYFQAYGVEGYIDELGWRVVGQIEYLGGLPNCGRVSYLQVDATFFQSGRIVATEFTNLTSVPQGSRVPFSINAIERSGDFRYELLLTQVNCD